MDTGVIRDAARGLAGLLHLPALLRVFGALWLDRRVSVWLKVASIAGIVYIFSPIDVFPDLLTGIGILDDVVVSFLIAQAFVRRCPRALVEEHCTRMGLDPSRLEMDILGAMSRAMNITAAIIERRKAAQASPSEQANGHAQGAATEVPGSAANPRPGEPEQEAPRFTRYSAFRAEKE